MDALDGQILCTLGIEPFLMWPPPSQGLRPSAVAESLGKTPQFVGDRLNRMEEEGVIAGYRVFPNLRQFGLGLATFHFVCESVPDPAVLERLKNVDGVVTIVWFIGNDLCIDLVHASPAERDRRIELIMHLARAKEPRALHVRPFPPVARRLSPLDWRILQVRQQDARRPLAEVAEAVGVTPRTVRNRVQVMRDEGAIDEYVELDLGKMRGVIPFQLAVWYEPDGPDPKRAVLEQNAERLLGHFHSPPGGYADLLLRVHAPGPPEVHAVVSEALALPGVAKAEALIATGGHQNREWIAERIAAQVAPRDHTAV